MGPLFWARRSPTRAARLRQHCGDVSLVEEGHGACGPVHKSTSSDVRRATPDLAIGAGACAGVTVGVVVVVAVVAAALARWIGGAGRETAAPAAAALQQRQQSTVGAAHNGFPQLGEETAHAAESAVVPPPPSGSVGRSTRRSTGALPCTASHRCTAAPPPCGNVEKLPGRSGRPATLHCHDEDTSRRGRRTSQLTRLLAQDAPTFPGPSYQQTCLFDRRGTLSSLLRRLWYAVVCLPCFPLSLLFSSFLSSLLPPNTPLRRALSINTPSPPLSCSSDTSARRFCPRHRHTQQSPQQKL